MGHTKAYNLLIVEEKYGKARLAATKVSDGVEGHDVSDSESTSSSSSDEEDDEGFLVTDALDAEISATLNAIRSKDPRVYDKTAAFYSEIKEDCEGFEQRKEKPMYLRDYHRQILLLGKALDDEAEAEDKNTTRTYVQQQNDLKRDIVKEIHSKVDGDASEQGIEGKDSADEDDGFFVTKDRPIEEKIKPSSKKEVGNMEDAIAMADKEPEQFLSNYLSSRAWVPTSTSRFQAFESDDEEEEQRAEEFERAFNFRFEDPEASNEKLMFHSRDAAAKYSVRRGQPTGRKKAREAEREKKEAEKREKREEMARLRKLKIEEAEEKVKRIKEAAGLRGNTISVEKWAGFLEEAWDMDRWGEEMNKRFGDAYYAENEEVDFEADAEDEGRPKVGKLRKPKWDDDIDIQDIVPDFDNDEQKVPRELVSSEDDSENPRLRTEQSTAVQDMEMSDALQGKRRSKKARVQNRIEQKKEARKERKIIEEIVDGKLDLESLPHGSSKSNAGRFRYRETSPITYGLTAPDILMASDSQLNQFVGLKKLATFRAPDKKRKDKKRLGKKARLRAWRKETFGSENAPEVKLGQELEGQVTATERAGQVKIEKGVDIREGKRKRKRSKKGIQGKFEVLGVDICPSDRQL